MEVCWWTSVMTSIGCTIRVLGIDESLTPTGINEFLDLPIAQRQEILHKCWQCFIHLAVCVLIPAFSGLWLMSWFRTRSKDLFCYILDGLTNLWENFSFIRYVYHELDVSHMIEGLKLEKTVEIKPTLDCLTLSRTDRALSRLSSYVEITALGNFQEELFKSLRETKGRLIVKADSVIYQETCSNVSYSAQTLRFWYR